MSYAVFISYYFICILVSSFRYFKTASAPGTLIYISAVKTLLISCRLSWKFLLLLFLMEFCGASDSFTRLHTLNRKKKIHSNANRFIFSVALRNSYYGSLVRLCLQDGKNTRGKLAALRRGPGESSSGKSEAHTNLVPELVLSGARPGSSLAGLPWEHVNV